MEHIELPQGNGQEIYIDVESLDIQPEWINADTQAIVMPDIPIWYRNPIYEAYKELFKKLSEMGYKIVTDSRMVNEDTFFFCPCLDKHINSTKEEFCEKKEAKIAMYLSSKGITKPLTISFPPTSFPADLPPLPFVLKNENSQGGIEKFLIKTPEQLEILKRFYEEINAYNRKKSIEQARKRRWGNFEFDENGQLKNEGAIKFFDYKKEFHQNMKIQEYVQTPTKYNTSLRVITSSSGDILAASLKYSEPAPSTEEKPGGLFDIYLSAPSSPYFMGGESITSNTVAGGNSILLDKEGYSELEQEILLAHGIDPNNATVPQEVMEASINVAVNCKHEIGAIAGMDFIYDEVAKKWKYLEAHEYPMLYSYAEKYNLPYDAPTNLSAFLTTDKLLDVRIRMHALALTMQKKLALESEDKRHM
ncbi:MAG: hypothetical protein K2M17_02935 [Bacilli bacterium]|nr:hypothetical protein [Bacilli bacterium]